MTIYRSKGKGINRKVYPIKKRKQKQATVRNIPPKKKKSEFEGYYKGEGTEPLEAVNEILRQLNYYDRGDIDFSTPDGKPISSKEFYEQGGAFSVVVTGYQHEYMVSGTVSKKTGRGIAGAGSEEVEF